MNLEELKRGIRRQYDPEYEIYEENMELRNKVELLQDRIQKAIEYIEWNLEANEEVIEYINFDGNFKKVLDILKGEE